MILLPSPEDFVGSGILDSSFLGDIYKCVIDETFLDFGRKIILHLPPKREVDVNTQSQKQPSQYNPYFGRVQAPITNTRNTGVKITPRDIEFTAHIKVGPLVAKEDITGIGDLKSNQIAVTLHISALEYVEQALYMTVEGRRYNIDSTPRPIGFDQRSYLIVKATEVNNPSVPQKANDG